MPRHSQRKAAENHVNYRKASDFHHILNIMQHDSYPIAQEVQK